MADRNVTGYIFPNIPAKWTQEEKNFALALRSVLDQVFSLLKGTRENRSLVDYLSMMQEIPIPADSANKVKKTGEYYRRKYWNIQMVWDAVDKEWITSSDYEKITGESYPNDRPE